MKKEESLLDNGFLVDEPFGFRPPGSRSTHAPAVYSNQVVTFGEPDR